jgi:hypothetical protein
MTTAPQYPRIDRDGIPLQRGDTVRIVGVPDLSQMDDESRREAEPVFRYLLNKYKRIKDFDERGHAEIEFRIPPEKTRACHSVWIEPCLLKRRARTI